MLRELKKLIDGSLQFNKHLAKLCQPLQGYFGIHQFSYYHVLDNGLTMILNSHHNYFNYYIQNKHYKYDPHIVHPNNIQSGIALWSSYDEPAYLKNCIFNLHQIFYLDHGISYIKSSNKEYKAYCFSSLLSKNKIYNKYFNELVNLERFINYFDAEKKHFHDLSNLYVDMSKIKGKKFSTQLGITKKSL